MATKRSVSKVVWLFPPAPGGELRALVLVPASLQSRPGRLDFPGGHVEPGDGADLLRAAARETREETGVDLSAHCFRIWSERFDYTQYSRFWALTFVVSLHPPPLQLSAEHSAAAIVPWSQARDCFLSGFRDSSLKDWLQQVFYRGHYHVTEFFARHLYFPAALAFAERAPEKNGTARAPGGAFAALTSPSPPPA